MLMLLSVHVTSFLFLVWFNNFALTIGVITRSYSKSPVLMRSWSVSYPPLSHDEGSKATLFFTTASVYCYT